MKFDESSMSESVTFIGEVLTGKRLKGKTLTNCLPFVKIRQTFPRQSFALYGKCQQYRFGVQLTATQFLVFMDHVFLPAFLTCLTTVYLWYVSEEGRHDISAAKC